MKHRNDSHNTNRVPPARLPPLDVEAEVPTGFLVAFWVGGGVLMICQHQPLRGL